MAGPTLDDVDRQLLTLLQDDARYSAVELADRVGVSDNTVHNRLADLEDAGIISGYAAGVPPKRVGLDFYFLFVCTARISDRGEVAENALALDGVVEVMELMTGRRNLHIKAVGSRHDDITRVARRVDDLKLEIEDEFLIREEHADPPDYTDLDSLEDAD